jgi:alpha-1,3-rhamnosyltransferase
VNNEALPETPLVSVVMPAFNHEAYVGEAIASVLAQTYPRVELIVVDDGSTDKTAEVIENISLNHEFTFLKNERNVGLNPTLMTGLSLARGEYVSVLASDDKLMPHKIARQIEHIRAEKLDGVYANGVKFWNDGTTEPIDLGHIARKAASGHLLEHLYCDDTSAPLLQSGLFSRPAMLELFPYRMRFKSDDWIILIKLFEKFRMGFINEPLFLYRQHENNSFRRYWDMLPVRLEVIVHATPPHLRARALANLFLSQAQHLYLAGERGMAVRFLLSSLGMQPTPAHWTRVLWAATRPAFRVLARGKRARLRHPPSTAEEESGAASNSI